MTLKLTTHVLLGWAKTTIDSTDLKDLRSLSGYLKYAKIQRISISQCIGTSGFEQVHPLRHICAVGELSEGNKGLAKSTVHNNDILCTIEIHLLQGLTIAAVLCSLCQVPRMNHFI